MTVVSTFGLRFRYARDFQRASGRWTSDGELAEELGLDSQSQISAYKSLTDAPPAPRVLAIAKRTGVDPGWLAFGPETSAPAPAGFEVWLGNQPTRKRGRAESAVTRAATKTGAPRLGVTPPRKRDGSDHRRSG